jgi:hypothetical protein
MELLMSWESNFNCNMNTMLILALNSIFMYQNTQKIILLWNMKLKLYVVIQKIKKLKKV